MKAVKFSLLVILTLSCFSFFGCPYEEGQIIDDPYYPSKIKITSPNINGSGGLFTGTWEVTGLNWTGPALKSDQGSIYPSGPAKKLELDIYSISINKDFLTSGFLEMPIQTVGGWDQKANLVLRGKDLPVNWKIETIPWRMESGLRKIRLSGPISQLFGEIARIYVKTGTDTRLRGDDSNESDFLMRRQLANVSMSRDYSANIYEQTSSVSLGAPTNHVKVDFVLPGSNDKLLEAKLADGPFIYWGELSCSGDLPVASSGSIFIKNWGIELIPRETVPAAAPPIDSLFVLKQTKQKNGSMLVEIKNLNSTSQISVERQWIENGFLFANIRYLNGPLRSIKVPTSMLIPANNPPASGKKTTTWGNIKKE